MSEIFQTLIKCYEALGDQTGRSDPAAATNTLMAIYSQPSSFQALVEFISTEGIDERYKRHCVVHIGLLFRKFYLNSPDDVKASIFVSLLKLTVLPDSPYVRRYVRDDVQKAMCPAFLPTAAAFIAQNQQNLNDIGIEASLYILTMMLGFQEEVGDIAPVSIPMIEAGLNSSSDNVKLAAVLHGLVIGNLLPPDQGLQLLPRYVECGIQLLMTYALSNDPANKTYLNDLKNGLLYLIDLGSEYINLSQMLNSFLQLLSNPQIIPEYRAQIQILTDVIIINSIDLLAEDENTVQMILQVYFQYAQSLFNPNELLFDLTDHNVYSSIFTEFSSYQNILELIWKIVFSISQTPDGRFASIVALYYCLSNLDSIDYFQSKIVEMSQLFVLGINDMIPCINEAAANAISALAINQKKQIKSLSDSLIQALIAKLIQSPNTEYIKSIDSLVRSAEDIGNIFSYVFDTITKFLSINDISLHYAIFNCLYDLVRYSPKQARHFFQPTFDLCSQVIASAEQPDLLKGRAISILSFLIESSPKLFRPFAQQFHQLVVQNLQSNDPQILLESIKAYGHLLHNFDDLLQESIPAVLPKLLELASKDISEKAETDDTIFNGEDSDVEDLDSKVEPIIHIVVSSICEASYALSVYPNLIETYLQPLLNVIQKQLDVGDSDCSLGCAEGCGNLIEGIQKLGFNEQTKPLISNIVYILSEIASSQNVGEDGAGAAFTAISDVIAADEVIGILCCYEHLGSILASVRDVFSGKMLYQKGKVKYCEELYPPAMRVVREIIAAMKNDSIKVVQDLIPLFNSLVTHKSSEMRDLILQFFGDLAFWASEATDDELKRNTFILAYDAIEKRNSAIGFGCIKQLAMKSPEVIQNNIQNLLVLIKAQLAINEDPPTESLQSIQDNAESALAMIAMNIMKENFPINDFLQISLSKMPAQLEVEENNDHLEFFYWLFQRAGELSIQQENLALFAAVPIRLFSDPLDKLEEYCVSAENVTKMIQFLKNFATAIPNYDAFIGQVCGNDSFKIESVLEALSS